MTPFFFNEGAGLKISLAQINPVVGDFSYNSGKIIRQAEEAVKQGCDLVIFPELALCGYPPQDLLERDSFISDLEKAMQKLVADIQGICVICGTVERRSGSKSGKPLYNSAVAFEDGKILFSARKRLLPTYDVFDETRYFEPGTTSELFTYKDLSLGVTVCEDIWNNEGVFPRKLYSIDTVAEMSESATIDMIINLSASPFQIGKPAVRYNIFSTLCRQYDVPLLYVNQTGGQDSLLFDGQSMALGRDGSIVAQAERFQEDMIVIDTDDLVRKACTTAHEPAVPEQEDTGAVFEALVMGVKDYVGKCGFSKALLGLSGGIDSSLTAAIACVALGPENVTGVALPSPYTSKESIEDARQLAENLGCNFDIIPITPMFQSALETLEPLFNKEGQATGLGPDVTEQNLQARIRGNILMALSNKFGALVLSTGNKSEMAVGYCTLYGDMNGGLAVISDVPKQLVYSLSRYVNRDREIIPMQIINKEPSAELAPDQRDQDDLPPYDMLDKILAAYLEEHKGVDQIVESGFDRDVVEDVVRRIKINEYKRKQAPLGLKVTSKSFGYGRRYPTAQNYKEY